MLSGTAEPLDDGLRHPAGAERSSPSAPDPSAGSADAAVDAAVELALGFVPLSLAWAWPDLRWYTACYDVTLLLLAFGCSRSREGTQGPTGFQLDAARAVSLNVEK